MRARKFSRTTLILVGWVLDTQQFRDSYLYDADKAHIYRPKAKRKQAESVKR